LEQRRRTDSDARDAWNEIRAVVVEVLGDLLAGASDPNDQSRRLDRVAEEIADAIGSA
jgi:hypothetical protein